MTTTPGPGSDAVPDAQPMASESWALPSNMRRDCATQSGLGSRPTNDWNAGDLPAPWAEGDVVALDAPFEELDGDEHPRLRGVGQPGLYVVSYATSIDEGDAWYFRVTPVDGPYRGSDRLHVWFGSRSTFEDDFDWMAQFRLIDTADPDGLAKRERMIAEGWSFESQWRKCPTCGNVERVDPADTESDSSPPVAGGFIASSSQDPE